MKNQHSKSSECLHINLFGGPACGKSTTAAGLFAKMKRHHMKCEYVSEVAKDLIYSKDFFTLADQLLILARQHHKTYKLNSQVDYTINDGIFLLSIIYAQENEHLPKELFEELIIKLFKSYNTLNIFLERNQETEYQEYGRNETEEKAKDIDEKILNLLKDNDIPYVIIGVNKKTVKSIFKLLNKN